MIKIKLKYKIGAVILGIILLLLSVVYTYFYLTGIEQIENNADNKLDFFHNSIQNQINKKLEDSSIELSSLKNQLENFNLNDSDLFSTENTDFIITQFLLGYSDYYTYIGIFDKERELFKKYKLLKVFTGEYKILTEEKIIDSSELQFLELNRDYSNSVKLIANAKEKSIFTSERMNGSSIYLIARLKFEIITEIFSTDAYLPDELKFFLFDSSGIIHSSNNLSKINSIITNYFEKKEVDYKNDRIFVENKWNTEYAKYKTSLLKSSKLILLSEINTTRSVDELNDIAINALFFSIFLIIIVSVIVNVFVNRISHSLKRITKVAQNVASGKFDEKLEIKRNDELGDLIDSFNKMTINLDQSYSELQKLNIELHNNYHELKRTKDALSRNEKLALIGETTSKISHEIQNKISAVSIWVQNLEIQLVNDDLSKMYLKEIKTSLENFLEMLVNFKKFYRQPKINKELFNLYKFLQSIECNYIKIFESKDISFSIIAYSEDIEMYAEQSLVEEAIVNLIINSIEHSPNNSSISVKIEDSKDEIVIAVSDEGTGVKEENVDHLFEPFYSTKNTGSGLGLAIVRNIVNVHGGSIELDSNYKKGARFVLKFPKK